MIVINSGKLIIPEEERFIGYAGDNLHSQKQFLVTNADDENCTYRLYLTFDNGTHNYFALDNKTQNGSTVLVWNVMEEHILKSGIVNAQIKAFSDNGEIYHTSSDYFYVAPSAEFSSEFSDLENAEFLRYEKTLNEILEKILSSSIDMVPQSRTIAGVNLVSDIPADTLRTALKTYPLKGLSAVPTEETVGKTSQLGYTVKYTTVTQTYMVDLYLCVNANDTEGVYKWVRINSNTVSDDQLASAVSEYLKKNPVESDRIDELYSIVEPLTNESINVFNKDDIVMDTNRYFAVGQSISRTFSKPGAFMTRGSFKCKKGDVINSNHSWVVEVLVYDDDGICVEQLSIDKTYTVLSENATQFTIQGTTQDVLPTLMVTVNNDMPSTYIPYSKNLLDKVNDIDAQLSQSKKFLKKPFVVLSFDAFNLTDNRFKIVNDEYGYKATVANTANEDINKTVMKAGWDIGLYRYDNFPPDIFGYDEAVSETPSDEVLDAWDDYVKTTIENAEKHGVFNPTSWLARQGCSCYGLEKALKKYQIPMCRGAYNPDYSNDTCYYADRLPTMTVSAKQTLMPSTLEDCASAVEDAVTNSKGVAFLTHGIYTTDDEANSSYGITEAALRSFLDTIKTYAEKGQLEVLTYRDVYEKYYPENAREKDYNRLYKVFTSVENGNEVAY